MLVPAVNRLLIGLLVILSATQQHITLCEETITQHPWTFVETRPTQKVEGAGCSKKGCCLEPEFPLKCGRACCPAGSICIEKKTSACEPSEFAPSIDVERLQHMLKVILREKADEDNNIAVTFGSHSTIPLLCNLHYSMQHTSPPITNFIVVAFDAATFKYCQEQQISVTKVVWHPVEKLPQVSKEKLFWLYKELMVVKQTVQLAILGMGYNVLALDTDIVFKQNFFTAAPNLHDYDVISQPTQCWGDTLCRGINGGFHYIRSSNVTITAVAESIDRIKLGNHHQDSINGAFTKRKVNVSSLTYKHVPTIDEYVFNCNNFRDEHRDDIIAVHISKHMSPQDDKRMKYNCTMGGWKEWFQQEETIQGKLEMMEQQHLLVDSCMYLFDLALVQET